MALSKQQWETLKGIVYLPDGTVKPWLRKGDVNEETIRLCVVEIESLRQQVAELQRDLSCGEEALYREADERLRESYGLEIRELRRELGQMEEQQVELQKDRERLDWYFEHGETHTDGPFFKDRAALDRARGKK